MTVHINFDIFISTKKTQSKVMQSNVLVHKDTCQVKILIYDIYRFSGTCQGSINTKGQTIVRHDSYVHFSFNLVD